MDEEQLLFEKTDCGYESDAPGCVCGLSTPYIMFVNLTY